MRSPAAATPSERLLAAMRPAPKLDRFDDMAIEMVAYANSLPFKEARTLIALQLRVLHQQGIVEGLQEGNATVTS